LWTAIIGYNGWKGKIMNRFVLIFIILVSTYAGAEEPKKAYFKERKGFFSHPTLIVDGRDYKSTPWKGEFEIQDAIKSNPKAFESLYIWGSLGLALGYLFATDRDNYSDTIYWGIFGTGFVLNIHHAGLARKELNKTIYFYNTEF
jgi:hypothetical protein